jgi:type IV pilus assembly protein PilO
MNLNELTLDNIGSWPIAARGLLLGLICIVIFGLFFTFDVKPLRAKLSQAIIDESTLRTTYQVKYSQIVNQSAYQQQTAELEGYIHSIIAQLPEQLDVPGLIADISKAGSQASLQFNYIKPLKPIAHEYYVELPIDISVNGNYMQLADFITRLAGMQRIVTLNDFDITRVQPTTGINNMAGSLTPAKTLLVMQLTIKTYKQNTEKKEPAAGTESTTGVSPHA